MKDKLRELIATHQNYAKSMRAEPRNRVLEFADELLSILDAEGDGGAVDRDVLAAGVRARNIEITRQQRAGEPNNEDHALRIGIAAALAAHPARSGVVRDEDVARMDWLVSHDVEVRDPRLHGSVHLFTAQTTSDEEDEFYRTSLREQIDSAIKGERHER